MFRKISYWVSTLIVAAMTLPAVSYLTGSCNGTCIKALHN